MAYLELCSGMSRINLPVGDLYMARVVSWRGVTTSNLAAETSAPVVAIDPFIGPSAEGHMRVFQQRTGSHDYANVAHDLRAIQPLMEPGGLIALHDTDHPEFPGSRRAVYEQRRHLELVAHIPDLVVFRVPGTGRRARQQYAA